MTKKHLMFILSIMLAVFLVAMDYPPSGTGKSNFRCSGGIVSIGDNSIDVLEKCGEPMRETQISDQPHTIWIYQFGQSNFIHYFAFLHDRLQRIHSVRCKQDNRDCK